MTHTRERVDEKTFCRYLLCLYKSRNKDATGVATSHLLLAIYTLERNSWGPPGDPKRKLNTNHTHIVPVS
jgi:hypothetical protein